MYLLFFTLQEIFIQTQGNTVFLERQFDSQI